MLNNDSIIVDANLILRWILNDIPEQSQHSKTVISTKKAFLLPEVLAEVVFVLKSVYKIERNKISEILIKAIPLFVTDNSDILITALELFSSRSIDFVDCILASYKKLYDMKIETFDKKLINLMKTFQIDEENI